MFWIINPLTSLLKNIQNVTDFRIGVNSCNGGKHFDISLCQFSSFAITVPFEKTGVIFQISKLTSFYFCQCWSNHGESQKGKNSYIIWHCTRICFSWLRKRLAFPSFNISIISWDPFDPLQCPLIYRTVVRNDCMLWWFKLLSMSIGFFLSLMYGRWCLK